MPQLTFHIGLGKTGTTSLQTYLSKQAAAHGCVVLPVGDPQPANHGLAAGLMGEIAPDWVTPVPPERLAEEVAASRARDERFVASSEIMSTPFFVNNDGPAKLNALFEGFDVDILLVVRNQIDLCESAFLQLAKTGAFTGTLDAWVRRFCKRGLGNFLEVIDAYAAVFGEERLKLIDYDRTDDLIASAMRTLGSDAPVSPMPRLNAKPVKLAALVLQDVSRSTEKRLIGPRFNALRTFADEILSDSDDGRLLSDENIAEIAAAYGDHNRRLARRFGVEIDLSDAERAMPRITFTRHDIDRAKNRLLAAVATSGLLSARGPAGG